MPLSEAEQKMIMTSFNEKNASEAPPSYFQAVGAAPVTVDQVTKAKFTSVPKPVPVTEAPNTKSPSPDRLFFGGTKYELAYQPFGGRITLFFALFFLIASSPASFFYLQNNFVPALLLLMAGLNASGFFVLALIDKHRLSGEPNGGEMKLMGIFFGLFVVLGFFIPIFTMPNPLTLGMDAHHGLEALKFFACFFIPPLTGFGVYSFTEFIYIRSDFTEPSSIWLEFKPWRYFEVIETQV